jgi:hypothetical protein
VRRPMMLAALTVAVALAAVGCGNGAADGNAGVADTQAVLGKVAQGNVVTRDQATCIADRATPKLSAQALKLSKKSTVKLADLPAADRTVIFTSYSACVTTAQLAPAVAKALTSGAAGSSATTAKCIASGLRTKYKTSGQLMAVMNSSKAAQLSTVIDACQPADQISQQLIQSMVNGGYTTTQATCVVQKVLGEVPRSKFDGTAGATLPADVKDKIVAATKACSSAG